MKFGFAFCFGLLIFQGKCDMGTPEKIQQTVVTGLQPYFANAQAAAVPAQRAIIGLTCMYGAGPQLPQKIMQSMTADRDILRKLNDMPYAALFGGVSYRYFLLGFDNALIRYDVQTKMFGVIAPPLGYDDFYRKKCGYPN
jgi:hypothetical protein